MEHPSPAAAPPAHLPSPPSELRAWLLACAIGVLGVGVALAALSGAFARAPALAPPPVLIVAPTPVASSTAAASALAAVRGSSSARRPPGTATSGLARAAQVRIATRWMEGFYPIYETAQSTFGVNWLLLASIHMQESAFSTASSTYHGLNFAHCCGGPMQFNVTNGRFSTWDLVAGSYVYARRPASYDHPTATHPSIYDDFDAIMAASHLLSASGAGYALDGSAWAAAYDYYGHDVSGVAYADEVLARAIGWSQRGFCINCGVQPAMLEAVHAAYGAPVLAALQTLPAHVKRPSTRTRRHVAR